MSASTMLAVDESLLQADAARDQQVASLPQCEEEELDAELRAETAALLADLENSRRETSALIAAHLNQNDEVCEAQADMNSQFEQLQEEAWKLTMFMELESIKQQLAQLSAIRSNLDMAEAPGDPASADTPADCAMAGSKPGACISVQSQPSTSTVLTGMHTIPLPPAEGAASGVARAEYSNGVVLASAGADVAADLGEDDREGSDDEDLQQLVLESEELQQQMEQELQVMQAQLEAVRHEALLVYERKQQLEVELMRMAMMDMKAAAGSEANVADDTAVPDVRVPELAAKEGQ